MCKRTLYRSSTTAKRTSMFGGSQAGWFTDTINAPPLFD